MKSIPPVLLALLIAAPAAAAHPGPLASTAIDDLPRFAAHIDAGAGIENIEERRDAVTTESAAPLTLSLGPTRFTLSGLIEAESSLVHVEGGDEEDDLRLSTVQVGLDAEIASWLGGHVIGLWEDDDTEPMAIDEAVLTITSPWQLGSQTPVLHLGRQYLPFGRFASAMISDPLTLELGETHTTAAVLALKGERWNVSLAAFEGSVDNGEAGLDDWVVAVETSPREGLIFGASWLSDLAESDAGLVQEEARYRDEVPGWSAFATLRHGDMGLTAEFLAAAGHFQPEMVEAGGDLTGRQPHAWYLEVFWQAMERLQLAVRYDEADDYQSDIRRYGATASYGLCDFALLAVEYLYADTGDPTHTFTAQLAVEF